MKFNPAAINALRNDELQNFIIASTPGGIEAQESAGQKSFCASTKIPIDLEGCTRESLIELGFAFPCKQSDDPLFVDATLPHGWSKRATDHSMWSEIIDSSGAVRFTVFYKAAFYDRRAFMVQEKKAMR